MVRTFCTSGEREVLKGAVHGAGGVLAALMAAYNIAAWCYRRERHLGVNAIVYTVATLWEVKQTSHHFERCLRMPGERTLTLVSPPTATPPASMTMTQAA
jgi:hypothetical protein